jgi:hypothetical protein
LERIQLKVILKGKALTPQIKDKTIDSRSACKLLQCDPSVHVFDVFCEQNKSSTHPWIASLLDHKPQIIAAIRAINKCFHQYLLPVLPTVICAVAVYLVYDTKITQSRIKDWFHVTEVTLRHKCQWLKEHGFHTREYLVSIPVPIEPIPKLPVRNRSKFIADKSEAQKDRYFVGRLTGYEYALYKEMRMFNLRFRGPKIA